MTAALEILTIGHSTHSGERFVGLVGGHDVELVSDVRRFPASRRNPQFNARALASALDAAGVAYEPLDEELGGRREPSGPAPRSGGERSHAFRAYAEYMETPEFDAGLARLEELARERRTAIMCAEGDWRHCHRRLIADALASRGWRILHIGRDGALEEHQPALS
ncbi:MAG TPA: DUF488 domain-containing protein [Solirubrobacterales bacterium]|nr:DUF488 domain-containing protein [Solirubrobacterales bacterium]